MFQIQLFIWKQWTLLLENYGSINEISIAFQAVKKYDKLMSRKQMKKIKITIPIQYEWMFCSKRKKNYFNFLQNNEQFLTININKSKIIFSFRFKYRISENIIYRLFAIRKTVICTKHIVYIFQVKQIENIFSTVASRLTCCTRNWIRCNNWIFTSTYVLPSRKPKNHYHIKWTHLLLTTNLQT